MKTRVLAALMALCTGFSMVSCKVADNNKNISSKYGGGSFSISGGKIHVRNNDRIPSCDVSYLYNRGVYEFTYDEEEFTLYKVDGGWELD